MRDDKSATSPESQRRLWRILVPIGFGLALPILFFSAIALRHRPEAGQLSTPTIPAPASVTFDDDYSDASMPWWGTSEAETHMYEAGYVSGEYRIAVHKPDTVFWLLCLAEPDRLEPDGAEIEVQALQTGPARLRLDDAEIQAEDRQVEGPLLGAFGLVVRSQLHKDSLYWFGISSAGYYWVDLLKSDEWIPLVAAEAPYAIRQGLKATNRLKVVCEGDRFDFYVNDALLTSLSDDTFGSGFFGLAVRTGEPSVVVHFDNLKVYALSE